NSTFFLQRGIKRCGYGSRRFAYSSVLNSWQENIQNLSQFIARQDSPVVLVGHSLGGLLSAETVKQHPQLKVEQIIMLGSPIAGSKAGRVLASWGIGRRMMGGSSEILQVGIQRLPDSVPVKMIAGESRIGAGNLLTRLSAPHDGTVAVEETRMDGLAEHVTLPVNHTSMLFSRSVVRTICRFLGEF
ncbi:MAG: alpha/beta hydrolase, partial [Gammaproteobacteria bacterium]|nr:alpha/beta hydrolase [Gammaproteobacteria bacterium]